MPESFVQVNVPASLGKKLATFEFTNGALEVVESEAVTLVDSAGAEVQLATMIAALLALEAKTPAAAGVAVVTAFPVNAVLPVTLLTPDATRLGFSIYNHSSTDFMYVLLANAGTVSPVLFSAILQPDAYFEAPYRYTGRVTAIWGTATGPSAQALVTDFKP